MKTGIEVRTDAGSTTFWPYREIRQTQGSYAGEEVRLERGGELPEALVIRDREFLASLREAGGIGARLYEPGQRRARVMVTIAAGLGVVALAAAIYAWGIPALAMVVAARVPVSWEESLGSSIAREVEKSGKRCDEPTRQRRIEEIVTRLATASPRAPYTFHVVVLDDKLVNAMAAPGGFVVVFRGLLTHTKTPEELAGVLAHEIEHVVLRHATRSLIQHMSTSLLLVALTGDVTGAVTYGAQAAQLLGNLQYSRRAEEEADSEGMRRLRAARVDPAGMIHFFESIEKDGGSAPAALKYLSTHPRTADRIARLRRLAAEVPGEPPVKLFEGYDWTDIGRMCAGAAR